jgi:hypothetical protein
MGQRLGITIITTPGRSAGAHRAVRHEFKVCGYCEVGRDAMNGSTEISEVTWGGGSLDVSLVGPVTV